MGRAFEHPLVAVVSDEFNEELTVVIRHGDECERLLNVLPPGTEWVPSAADWEKELRAEAHAAALAESSLRVDNPQAAAVLADGLLALGWKRAAQDVIAGPRAKHVCPECDGSGVIEGRGWKS